MKTKIMSLTLKGETIYEYACSACFAVLDEEDIFCWNCGVELDTEDIAYDSNDLKLKKELKEEK